MGVSVYISETPILKSVLSSVKVFCGVTVTVQVVFSPLEAITVIVATPSPLATILPLEFTVATAVLLLLNVFFYNDGFFFLFGVI